MNGYIEISPDELNTSAFKMIGKDWLLITVRDESKESGINAMTASWGSIGVLWGKPTATVYIRPQRYSYRLAETEDKMSLCFFGEEYRDVLKFCGSHSGRDTDKIKELGLSSDMIDGAPVLTDASLVLICKKAYADDIKKDCFIGSDDLKHYANGDFHRFYILEIEKILAKDSK